MELRLQLLLNEKLKHTEIFIGSEQKVQEALKTKFGEHKQISLRYILLRRPIIQNVLITSTLILFVLMLNFELNWIC